MKIALIYFGRRGGGPLYSLEIGKRLSQKAEVLAFISKEITNFKNWQESGLHLFAVSTYKNIGCFFFSFLNLPKFLALKRRLKKFSPDVIYYPFFHPWFLIINLFSQKIPKVFTVHDPFLHKGEKNFILQKIQDAVIKKAARVIVLSRASQEAVFKKGVPTDKIDIIPHGPFDYYQKVGETLSHTVKKEPTILFFGRILEYKGLEVLLRAFPLIKKQLPETKLLIVGEGDFRRYCRFLSHLRDVEIVNRWINDEEVSHYFSRADLLVCPYLDASQSGVIPLAYFHHLPVVASRVGGLEEQVVHGLTGLLVKPGEPAKLAGACLEILKDNRRKEQMGENGYLKAVEEWNWQSLSDKVMESLKKAINQSE